MTQSIDRFRADHAEPGAGAEPSPLVPPAPGVPLWRTELGIAIGYAGQLTVALTGVLLARVFGPVDPQILGLVEQLELALAAVAVSAVVGGAIRQR